MKDKLKAIWRILRAKSYFYTVHINGKYISNHEMGNQPKGGYPAYARVEIMFGELRLLAGAAKEHIRIMENRYHRPSFIDQESTKTKSCADCNNYGTMDCPNSNLCFSRADHPYFTPKTEEKQDGKQ